MREVDNQIDVGRSRDCSIERCVVLDRVGREHA